MAQLHKETIYDEPLGEAEIRVLVTPDQKAEIYESARASGIRAAGPFLRELGLGKRQHPSTLRVDEKPAPNEVRFQVTPEHMEELKAMSHDLYLDDVNTIAKMILRRASTVSRADLNEFLRGDFSRKLDEEVAADKAKRAGKITAPRQARKAA